MDIGIELGTILLIINGLWHDSFIMDLLNFTVTTCLLFLLILISCRSNSWIACKYYIYFGAAQILILFFIDRLVQFVSYRKGFLGVGESESFMHSLLQLHAQYFTEHVVLVQLLSSSARQFSTCHVLVPSSFYSLNWIGFVLVKVRHPLLPYFSTDDGTNICPLFCIESWLEVVKLEI